MACSYLSSNSEPASVLLLSRRFWLPFFGLIALLFSAAGEVDGQANWYLNDVNWNIDGGYESWDMPDQILGASRIVRVHLPAQNGSSCWFPETTNLTISCPSAGDYGTIEVAFPGDNGHPTNWSTVHDMWWFDFNVGFMTIPIPIVWSTSLAGNSILYSSGFVKDAPIR